MGRLMNQVKKALSSTNKRIQKTKNNKTVPLPQQEGLTYIATNPSLLFQLKIGEHHKSFDIQNRLKSLNNTSVSEKFIPVCVIKSKHCTEIERMLHDKFMSYRITPRREFFGFRISTETSSTEFDYIKKKYQRLLQRVVKKMCKYAIKYDGEIIM
jgi:hypothetical protein